MTKTEKENNYEVYVKASRYDVIIEVLISSIQANRWNGEKTYADFNTNTYQLENVVKAFEAERVEATMKQRIKEYDEKHPYESEE